MGGAPLRDVSMNPRKILIIEDSPEVADLMESALRGEGMEVWKSADAEGGLELARREGFDLALVDLVLPGMDGLEACAVFRSEPGLTRVPVIMMTGRQSTEDKVRAFALGAVDYINKPFVIPEVLARVHATLQRKARFEEWERAHQKENARTHEEMRRLGSAVDHAADAIAIVAEDNRVLYSNSSFAAMFGGFSAGVEGVFPLERLELAEDGWSTLWETCRRGRSWSGEVPVRSPGGAVLFCLCRASLLTGGAEVVLLFTDLTERKRLEGELLYLANHDPLTGLANRRYFSEQLDQFLETRPAKGYVFYLDLDQFKAVNAAAGFETGDRLLKDVAGMIQSEVNPTNLVARFGGDDFVVLMREADAQEALALARRLVERFDRHRFFDKGRAYPATASVGVAQVRSGRTAEDHLSDVASACFVAKERGRNGFAEFQPDEQALRQLDAESRWSVAIKDALREDRMEIWLQPILPVREAITRVYFEVLLRMRDTGGERILPGAFMIAAQRFGNMALIDRFVIRRSIQLLQAHPSLHLAINLSAQTLGDPELPDFLEESFRERGVDAARASFEITETAAIQNLAQTRRLIDRIKQQGSTFALDDFGSGFSSMTYLRDLPVDYVKIEGNFIKHLDQDAVSRSLVRAMHETAHILGKQTVAEFVTNPQVFRHVVEIGLDFAQGWHICEPAPPEQFLREGFSGVSPIVQSA